MTYIFVNVGVFHIFLYIIYVSLWHALHSSLWRFYGERGEETLHRKTTDLLTSPESSDETAKTRPIATQVIQ